STPQLYTLSLHDALPIFRHDVWDLDFPAAPNLVRVKRDGRMVDAVAQVTKTGYVFVLDRRTGAPLFPIQERPVPASPLDGEQLRSEEHTSELQSPYDLVC